MSYTQDWLDLKNSSGEDSHTMWVIAREGVAHNNRKQVLVTIWQSLG